jgi:hypothetical protein
MRLNAATDTVVKKAVKRAPATIKQRRPSFKIYTVSQLLETYRDPRAVLLEIASTDTAKLAETIGCSLQEALGERRLAAQAVLPYVAQKLPVQVDMRHTKAIHLNIVDARQYESLQQVAGDDSSAIEAQLIEHIGREAAAEDGETVEEAGSETDVLPPVSPTLPGAE